MASRWCDHDADAQDVAQEVLLRLLSQRRKPFRDTGWTYVVTRRVCHAMRKARIRSGDAEETYASAESRAPVESDAGMQTAAVLQELPARDRVLLDLVVRGLTAPEIALYFGCKTRDVGQMISRARSKARRLRDRKTQL